MFTVLNFYKNSRTFAKKKSNADNDQCELMS